MVKRDRNHASVAIWSFCNEGGCNAADGKAFRAVTYQVCCVCDMMGSLMGAMRPCPQSAHATAVIAADSTTGLVLCWATTMEIRSWTLKWTCKVWPRR